jgi:diguanylate cyclase (GGDEF)-like protein
VLRNVTVTTTARRSVTFRGVAPNPPTAADPPHEQDIAWETIADGARLAAVCELGVLDTAPESAFDRFTSLVCDLLDVPISLISLIDRDRQFFKSARGLSGPWAEARETPLSHALCQYPVATGEPFVVSDAHADRRVADNLAVRDMAVVAYAGFPLVLADGHAAGALCAIDHVPREWSPRELRILSDLAAAVGSLLDLRRTLARQSLHDALTGLPNRALAVAYSQQLSNIATGADLLALAVGIDDLGSVNSGYGIAQGDQVINLVARRIAHQLSSDDVLGRLRGDTFIVIRPRVDDPDDAPDLAQRIGAAVCAEPVTVRGDQLEVSVTIGTASAAPGTDGDLLIGRALESLSAAKRSPDQLPSSGVSRPAPAFGRPRLRGALSGAVRRGEISVNFQPIVELATGRTRGYEALARWRHPELGVIGPSEFIPVAEATGDIVIIGEHVLRTACTQLAIWRAMLPGEDLGVTVNFSPLQLAVPNIPEVVAGVLADTGLPGAALTLEITEGVFISPAVLQRRNLDAIRGFGVQLALDDFGTGYSALSYLKRLPVDVIKVDRCFLDGLETDRRDVALMRAILAIGASMDLEVVAEGVETRAQRELLRLSGCHLGQGFLFAEPLPAEQIHLTERPAAGPGGPARLVAAE